VRRRLVFLAAVFFAAGLAVSGVLRRSGPVVARPTARPVNFAHRGGAALAPENTLEAFRRGLKAGADRLEMDLHLSRDGRVVVIHDATVNRTTDGAGAVREMTLREIRQLDAGYRFTPDGETYPFRGRGIKIPTLEEVYREFPGVPVNVEIKAAPEGWETMVWDVIRSHRAGDRTIVAAANHDVIRRFREVSGGEVPTAASGREVRDFLIALRLGRTGRLKPAYRALQVPVRYRGVRIVTPRFVAAAHALGLRVDVWTVNDPRLMRRMLDMGVDGIMTDRPDLLAEILKER
jgi:glycerophosphoryl diester phosphodiesterase